MYSSFQQQKNKFKKITSLDKKVQVGQKKYKSDKKSTSRN